MKDAKILKTMRKHEKMTSGTPAKDLFAILICTMLSKCPDNINLPINKKQINNNKKLVNKH